MAKQNPAAASAAAKNGQELPKAAFDQALLAWMAPRYLRYERGWIWFAVLFVLAGAMAVYGYFEGSWPMVAFFAILPFVLILEHLKKPEDTVVVVSPYGIRFGELRIPYSHIRRFWILHNPPFVDELHILTDSRVHPELTIQLMGTDAALLRQYLVTQALEWEGKSLGAMDMLVRILRLT